MTFAELDVLSLDLEHTAAFDHDVDLVIIVRRLAVCVGRREHVDADLEPGGAVDDLVAAGVGCEPFLDAGDVERLRCPQGTWFTLGLTHVLSDEPTVVAARASRQVRVSASSSKASVGQASTA